MSDLPETTKAEGTKVSVKAWTWTKVKDELDKCTLLCFNCHMEEHAND